MDADGRCRTACEGRPDIFVGLFQQRQKVVHLRWKDALIAVAPVFRVGHAATVTGKERPVHRPPVIKPKPLHFQHLAACRLVFDGRNT